MTQLNKRIANIEIPVRMRQLRISNEGYPVPWFVPWVNEKPEFRGMDAPKFSAAIRQKRCLLCGDFLGRHMTFVIGPMCAVNRVSAEPPCHYTCALYAVKACPFLTQPRMRRNEKDMPIDATNPAGMMIKRNPGVTLMWTTKKYDLMKIQDGYLIKVGDPEKVEFFAEGRTATRQQILDSINSGLPILVKQAEKDGQKAVAELAKLTNIAMKLVLENSSDETHSTN
jgi:hypothetical protein